MKLKSGLRGLGGLCVCLAMLCNSAWAAERVSMMSPADNAAYVPYLNGMVNSHKVNSFLGTEHTIDDGIVIRQSRIENGKIIIPPGGLYVTSRSGNWEPFRGKPLSVAGKEYVAINQLSERVVIRNVKFAKDQIIPLDRNKTRGMQLTKIETQPIYDLPGQGKAVFKLVKATGNYYGSEFPVYSGDMITNLADKKFTKGTKEKEGYSVADAKNKIGEKIYASNFGSVGRTYVVVGNITDDEVEVLEMTTDNSTDLYISPSTPQVKEVANGDVFSIGQAEVKVLELTKDSVKLRISDAQGSVEKVLGPYNDKNMKWVPISAPACDVFWMLSKSGRAALHMNVFKEGGPFSNGKVSLVAYSDVINVQNMSVWQADPRFLALAET